MDDVVRGFPEDLLEVMTGKNMSCADLFCGEAKAAKVTLEFLELPKMERVLALRWKFIFFSCKKFRMGSWL